MSIMDKLFWNPVLLKVFDSSTYCDIIPFVIKMPCLLNYEDFSVML